MQSISGAQTAPVVTKQVDSENNVNGSTHIPNTLRSDNLITCFNICGWSLTFSSVEQSLMYTLFEMYFPLILKYSTMQYSTIRNHRDQHLYITFFFTTKQFYAQHNYEHLQRTNKHTPCFQHQFVISYR